MSKIGATCNVLKEHTVTAVSLNAGAKMEQVVIHKLENVIVLLVGPEKYVPILVLMANMDQTAP